jgi:hypothetical protein
MRNPFRRIQRVFEISGRQHDDSQTLRDWGTTAILLIDLAATLGVSAWGILFLKTDLKYLLLIVAIALGLALVVAMLLRAGRNRKPSSGND